MSSDVVKGLFRQFMYDVNRAAPPSSDDVRIREFGSVSTYPIARASGRAPA
jgi:hypothetical protein